MRIASSALYTQTVYAIDANQTTEVKLQNQLSSGKRLLTAGDDPTAAGQVLGVNKTLASIAQWQSNTSSLQSTLGLEDSTLSNVSQSLSQINSLAVQANSGALTQSDRQNIAAEMQQQLNQLVGLANTKDASGRYLFGGTQNAAAPFTVTSGGVSYSGNSTISSLQVGVNSEIAGADPGDSVFMNSRSGDGTIVVGANAANTGTAYVTSSAVTDPSQATGGTYSVSFTGGQYTVTDANNAVVSTGTYTDGSAIQFQGVSLTLTGTPADGDSFSVGPSKPQSVFATIQNLINTVSAPSTGSAGTAQNQTAFYAALQALGTAQTHISSIQGGVGAREQALTSSALQLSDLSTQFQATLSNLQDVDYAAATTQLAQVKTGLQAAEQTYSSIQGLSLFNYLK